MHVYEARVIYFIFCKYRESVSMYNKLFGEETILPGTKYMYVVLAIRWQEQSKGHDQVYQGGLGQPKIMQVYILLLQDYIQYYKYSTYMAKILHY